MARRAAQREAREDACAADEARRNFALRRAVAVLSICARRAHVAAEWHKLHRAWARLHRRLLPTGPSRPRRRAVAKPHERVAVAAAHRTGRDLRAALASWRSSAACYYHLAAARSAAAAAARRAQLVSGWDRWHAWLRLAARWRSRVERRAEALGGAARRHLPCMRGFEARAIFVEEGHAGVVAAYRRRRCLAVALCGWVAVTCMHS